ncbi:hypothetical protein BDP27DRAFT_1341393, partial [Rhodocollybia butyracea]
PLGSPYGTSVIAAYRSAGQLKDLSERIWFLWTICSHAQYIILGSIVTRCPSMSLAPSALLQLDSACELFSKAASGFKANKVYEYLNSFQQPASASASQHSHHTSSMNGSAPSSFLNTSRILYGPSQLH